uniref:Low density lipoprotein receptor class A domain containing 1 n=1 Tax=Monodelphis domestica TaxID=13616 RepID=A0A5F8GFK1_MONDO
MNRIFPQPTALEENTEGEIKTFAGEEDCGGPFSCCSRRGFWLSVWALLLLVSLTAVLWLVSSFGLPPPAPVTRACATASNQTGFLCDDRQTCVPASLVCDGVRTCPRGEDEDSALCGNVPHSLPSFLVFRCSHPTAWTFEDKRCDGSNDCGDCSDEGAVARCPPCGPQGWGCTPTFFQYCGCVPRSLCRDGVQHCSDWSDEYACPGR